jgi:hypothetical protein
VKESTDIIIKGYLSKIVQASQSEARMKINRLEGRYRVKELLRSPEQQEKNQREKRKEIILNQTLKIMFLCQSSNHRFK